MFIFEEANRYCAIIKGDPMMKMLQMMILLFTTTAFATTYYVVPTGSDSNNGSQSTPWKTISHAASSVIAGDTVIVADGTYVEAPYLNHSGASGIRITFKSQNKWGAVIAPTSTQVANASGIIVSVAASYITIQDFEIVGPSSTNSEQVGIKAPATSNGLIVKGNKIHHIGTSTSVCQYGGGLLFGAPGAIIDSNVFYDIGVDFRTVSGCYAEQAIYLFDGNAQKVTNNIITNMHGTAISMNGGNTVLNFPSNEVITNNTIVNVVGDGIYMNCYSSGAGPCDYNNVSNNILASVNTSGQAAIFYEAQNPSGSLGTHNLYNNNLVYNSSGYNWITGQTNYVKTVTTNPQFVNNTGDQTGDYHLQSTSPAKDAGTSTGAPSTDFDGNTRPQGTGYDIGAYEYVSSSPSNAPAAPTGLTVTVQ
jgi:Protein of unknown function (DUF1565)